MKYWKTMCESQTTQENMAQTLGITTMVAGVLQSRGMDVSTARTFLSTDVKLHDPYLMKGMEEAVKVIRNAIDFGKRVAIFGDYDCDGVTATALLTDYLDNVGCDVLYYIPSRESEGYGLNKKAILKLHQEGVELIITVDNGISGIEEVAYAKELGMEVVITDHHRPREIVPLADAILNPHQEGCNYPFKELCGAGVAFKLICALDEDIEGYEMLMEYSDLLAIGTVADVVELRDENRVFVREGLSNLQDTRRMGIRTLLDHMGLEGAATAETISYGLAPRINSVGRLDTAELAVLLLLTEDPREVEEIIEQIQSHNQNRKDIELQIYHEIKARVEKHPEILKDRVLVFYGENWNAGVIGIVASRVVTAYGKPAIIISLSGNEGKASGRSIEGFSLIEGVFACADLLEKYGGHPMAAGFSLVRKNIPAFVQGINEFAKNHYFKMPVDSLNIHYTCGVEELGVREGKSLHTLEPFGAGNERPNFCVRGVKVTKIHSLSEGKHQRLTVEKLGQDVQILFFSRRREEIGCREGDVIDVVFTLSVSTYNGNERVTLKGLDLHLSAVDQENYFNGIAIYDNIQRDELKGAKYVPTREEVGAIYRYIRTARQLPLQHPQIYYHATGGNMPYSHYLVAIEAMLELGLITIRQTAEGDTLMISPVSAKVSLENSTVIRRLLDNETKSKL